MKTYAIKAIFDTLQGEGARAGERSVFVRFAGCNLWDGVPAHRGQGKGACAAWCDTDFVGGRKLTAGQLLAEMPGSPTWCVLTGGEPLLQVDRALIEALGGAGWRVAVETNGTLPWPGPMAWRCVSPKLGAKLAVVGAEEVKVILPGGGSGWSDDQLVGLEQTLVAKHYFVQPQDPIQSNLVEMSYLHGNSSDRLGEQYRANLARCLAFVHEHPRWRLSLQTHKFSQIP